MEVVTAMKPASSQIRKIHRRLALVFCVSALLSSGSGVLHTVMSRTQPPPPKAQPAGRLAVEKIRIGTREALAVLSAATNGGSASGGPASAGNVKAVSIRSIAGEPWYQFMTDGKPDTAYVSAQTGEFSSEADARYAEEIASSHLGGAVVRQTKYLTAYDSEYLNIFRILPVYRFDAEDGRGTRVYVSTMTGSVTRDTNDHKQFEAAVFSNFHKLMFIPNKDARDFVLAALTLGIFAASLAGLVLYTVSSRKGS